MQNLTTTTARTSRATRVVDGNGREWALMANGAWGCLGHAITVDSLEELDRRYVWVATS